MHENPQSVSQSDTETARRLRNRIGLTFLGATVTFLLGAIVFALLTGETTRADPDNPQQVALGKSVYAPYCGACHGANLEGQPDWEARLPNGRMPAPPHDASGHTWHHPDSILFGITKYGLVPGKYAPPNYESDMPAFGNQLSDEEIWAVLAYIKSTWPEKIRAWQMKITRDAARR
jgi:S-disulfanyl-L-cysteine oxidoreductase SoxD